MKNGHLVIGVILKDQQSLSPQFSWRKTEHEWKLPLHIAWMPLQLTFTLTDSCDRCDFKRSTVLVTTIFLEKNRTRVKVTTSYSMNATAANIYIDRFVPRLIRSLALFINYVARLLPLLKKFMKHWWSNLMDFEGCTKLQCMWYGNLKKKWNGSLSWCMWITVPKAKSLLLKQNKANKLRPLFNWLTSQYQVLT